MLGRAMRAVNYSIPLKTSLRRIELLNFSGTEVTMSNETARQLTVE